MELTMYKSGRHLFYCLLLLICLQQIHVCTAVAGEKEERVQLLQQKMEKLQQLLVKMQEQKLREEPPTEIPWQALLQAGSERQAYDQYAYLLAPQMRAADLDGILQQLHFLAQQDELKERGTLFVVPALPLASGEAMSVKTYNRDLAGDLLEVVGIPTALEGGLIVAPAPLIKNNMAMAPLLFIDLVGCDQMVRSQIFGLLQTNRLYTEDGSFHAYFGELLKKAAPTAFNVYRQENLIWLSLAHK